MKAIIMKHIMTEIIKETLDHSLAKRNKEVPQEGQHHV
jgi:hypothetical protein